MDVSLDTLKVGDKITFGRFKNEPITWIKVSKENDFISEFTVSHMYWDAAEYGRFNPDYSLSNIKQWLLSTEISWFAPTHPNDTCNVADQRTPGFLSGFTQEEYDAIYDVNLPVSAKIASVNKAERWQYFRKHGVRSKRKDSTSYTSTLCQDIRSGYPISITASADLCRWYTNGGIRPVLNFVPGVKVSEENGSHIVFGIAGDFADCIETNFDVFM